MTKHLFLWAALFFAAHGILDLAGLERYSPALYLLELFPLP